MKCLITENQLKTLLSENDSITVFNQVDIKNYEKILTKQLRKYSWFKEIEISYLSVFRNTMAIQGVITVDVDWGYKQWREYQGEESFPVNDRWEKTEDYVSFGDIIGGDQSKELQQIFLFSFRFLSGIPAKTLSWSWLVTKFV